MCVCVCVCVCVCLRVCVRYAQGAHKKTAYFEWYMHDFLFFNTSKRFLVRIQKLHFIFWLIFLKQPAPSRVDFLYILQQSIKVSLITVRVC
jgi:hypothetical protein